MPVTLPPWSYSFISTYINCPWMAHGKYIQKIKEPQSEAMLHGNAVHKALEEFVAHDVPLRQEYKQWEPMAASIRRQRDNGAIIETEKKLGVRANLAASGFFELGVYGRGVVDVLTRKGRSAWIGDWKTGKVKENDLQTKIFAAFVFTNYPEVDTICANNIWLQTSKIGEQYDFNRIALPRLWSTIIPHVQMMELSAARDSWPKRPSGLCGWCPVKDCEHNPRRT